MYIFWLVGGFIAVMVGLFFDDFSPNSETGVPFGFWVTVWFYVIVFVVSWFSLAIMLGQLSRKKKDEGNDDV